MKISVLQEDLNKGLSVVSRSVSTKATLPILSNILIGTDDGRLKLSATNLETGVNYWLGAKIEEEGSITIPAKILAEFVSTLPSEKVELETKENLLIVSSGSFKGKISGLDASEFPKVPSVSDQYLLSFKKEELTKSLSQVVISAAQDEGRPVLTGVYFVKEVDNLSLVATDGYRLSVRKIAVQSTGKEEEGKRLLIPAKTLTEVTRIAQESGDKDSEIKLGFTKEKSQVIFSFPNIEFSSRLIEGDFPDYHKIIPQNFITRAVFDKDDFLRSVKMASIFAREQANIVKLKLDPVENNGKMSISAETPQIGANESEIEATVEGDKIEIAFNFRFLLDFLNAVSSDQIDFEANGPLSSGVFKPHGDASFLHIIMPVRIQN